MATMATTRADAIPGLSHRRWIEIGAAENDALIRQLESLPADAWERDTDCPGWTVKDVASHVLGAAEGFTSFAELRRQLGGAKKRKKEFPNQLAAMNQIQVEDRQTLAAEELIARMRTALPRFIKLRRRVGGVGRVIPLYDSSVLGVTNVHYLMDPIYARDVFMHRVDIARATRSAFEFIGEDRELVTDVVRDWARRRKPDVELALTGAMEQTFSAGDATHRVSVDAVEFCRAVSGRAPTGLQIDGDETKVMGWIQAGCPF